MEISLLFARDDHQIMVEEHLRSLGQIDFVRSNHLFMPPPWSEGIILADWTALSHEQRIGLLYGAQHSPCMALIIFAPVLSGDDARQMLHGGVADILHSLMDLEAIASAVQEQIAYLQHRQILLTQQQDAAQTLSALTPREQDILRALSGGASNKLAARQLGISPRTVEVHRANMLRRTGAACISDLLRIQQAMDIAGAALCPALPHPAPVNPAPSSPVSSSPHDSDQPCRRDLPMPVDRVDDILPHWRPSPTPELAPAHRRLIYTAAADRLSSGRLTS